MSIRHWVIIYCLTFLFYDFLVQFKGRKLGFIRQSTASAVQCHYQCCNNTWAATLAHSLQSLPVSEACSWLINARTTHYHGSSEQKLGLDKVLFYLHVLAWSLSTLFLTISYIYKSLRIQVCYQCQDETCWYIQWVSFPGKEALLFRV